MVFDISALLELDPVISEAGAQVTAYRLSQNGPDTDGDFRYELAARLEKGRRWPKGQYYLVLLDRDGVQLKRAYVSQGKTTEKGVRQLEAGAYSQNIGGAQLVLEVVDWEDQASESEGSEPSNDGWIDLEVIVDRRSTDEVGLDVDGLAAQAHAHFEVANQIVVEVRAVLSAQQGRTLPRMLSATVVVRDVNGRIIDVGDVNLASSSTYRSRPFNYDTTVYRHTPPASVEVAFGLEVTASDELVPGIPPAYGTAMMTLLKDIDAKLDQLLEE